MTTNRIAILPILRRAAAVLLLAVTAISSFAVLGDGKTKTPKNSRNLLSNQTYIPGRFSLKSGYTYKGNQVLTEENRVQTINLNTVLTYQKGNTTYIVPLKKKIYITTTNAGFTINH